MQSYQEAFKEIGLPRSFKAGATLYFQGEIPRRGYYVADGFVKIYTISNTGDENSIFIIPPNSLLPISWLMGTSEVALFNYEALTDCRLYSFNKDDLSAMLDAKPELHKPILNQISQNFSASLLHVNGLEQTHAEDKIAYTLYYLLFQYGMHRDGEMYELSFKMNHKLLAGLVGVTRESTTKVMLRLKRLGIVNYDRTSIEINKSKLERHIGEEIIVNFSADQELSL